MTINKDALQAMLIEALKLPINDWDKATTLLEGVGDKNYQHAVSALSALSVRAGELAYYLGYRGAFGTGDHGHQNAQDAATKRRKTLRKANGYSYP